MLAASSEQLSNETAAQRREEGILATRVTGLERQLAGGEGLERLSSAKDNVEDFAVVNTLISSDLKESLEGMVAKASSAKAEGEEDLRSPSVPSAPLLSNTSDSMLTQRISSSRARPPPSTSHATYCHVQPVRYVSGS